MSYEEFQRVSPAACGCAGRFLGLLELLNPRVHCAQRATRRGQRRGAHLRGQRLHVVGARARASAGDVAHREHIGRARLRCTRPASSPAIRRRSRTAASRYLAVRRLKRRPCGGGRRAADAVPHGGGLPLHEPLLRHGAIVVRGASHTPASMPTVSHTQDVVRIGRRPLRTCVYWRKSEGWLVSRACVYKRTASPCGRRKS